MFVVAFGAFVGAAIAMQSANADAYTLERSWADCVVRNQQRYLATRDSLLYIYPSLCPTLNPTQAQRDYLAQATVVVPNAASTIIVLTRRERACFFRRLREQVARAPRGQRVSVSTANCA